ncbi:ALOX5 [Branchiostoma lanceolatum]|uniref:ALOX5 protein n=1 Tax=Branchiostoma lanceolatum TaxID=7740 RepID=A0A8J9WFH0_BRALA|nr:ALOX5 [Branchiostoma lanceolatum]
MGIITSKPKKPKYRISVKTGDVQFAGTDADVYLAFYDGNGKRSRDVKLDVIWRNDFERGSTDVFKLGDLGLTGPILQIEVWRGRVPDDWYVEKVEIERLGEGETDVFPVHRWIRKSTRLKLTRWDSVLPQFDPNLEQRQREMEEMKANYELMVPQEGLPPKIKNLPPDEDFSADYKWNVAKRRVNIRMQQKISSMTTGRFKTLDDLINVYEGVLGTPKGVENWRDDREFGRQRLSGCNPNRITLCTEVPNNFAVTGEMVEPFLEGRTFDDALQAKRIFMVNYKVMEDLDLETSDGRQLCCPMCLLYRDINDDLYPIAIQLFQHGDQNPVFLPSDPPYTWLLAKMWFNNADASFHQSTTHIGKTFSHIVIHCLTHLMAEPFAVSAKRQLSRSHPLFKLMAPHFIFLIPINFKALATLMAPNAWVDENMGIGRQGTYNLIKKVLKEWRLDVQGTLPADLKDRGVDDPDILPGYYFRDDAILLYNAIHKYVRMVVEAVYDDASKIVEDYELQAWAKEIVNPAEEGGCGMQGISGNGQFTTTDQIVAVVTSVVYICSAGHAAANFAQYDEYGFPPNYPAYLHGQPPRDKAPRTEQDIIDQLPDKSKTLEMMVITRMLSDRSTNGLGMFEVEYMYDPEGTRAVAEFRKDLDKIHEIIKERNKTRKQPYVYLDPREVPNAISI